MTVHGIPVTVSSAAEAAQLLRELGAGGGATPAPAAAPASPPAAVAPPRFRQEQESFSLVPVDPTVGALAIRFLKAIRENPDGIQVDGIMAAIGLDKPKAVGSRSAAINSLLKNLGFKVEAVYRNPRQGKDGGRLWQPARKIGEAISLIEQRLAAD